MRVTPTRVIILVSLALVLYMTWTTWFQQDQRTTCFTTKQFQDDLHKLTDRVNHILTLLSLTHFLCYGALWGQIRLSRTLPWESNSNFCLLNEELTTKDEVYIVRMFRKHALEVVYDSSEGQYTVTDTSLPGMTVFLTVFELDKVMNMYRRIGWKRRVLPPDCEAMTSLQCFPPRLIQTPLPLKEFGQFLVPVPREGIELQKYLYRHNWWKEVMPSNC